MAVRLHYRHGRPDDAVPGAAGLDVKMPSHTLSERRKRGLPSQAKAKKMAKEGLSSAGDGFHSEAQKNLIGLVAGGGKPTRLRRRKHKK